MRDPAYQEAYEYEEERERLQQALKEWRTEAGLTSAQVAERMGVKPPTVSRMEKNATRMSYETLLRYAHACGVTFKLHRI
ncbi:transcriptional regulator [Kosakonia pseudosacchari]|uniref:Transcriptional regulator n=2 Tax=Kosakonia pseudosacchari TaxID=1646340 RepID=A0ABX4INC4_9ENTR|nr:transcriptional regulator [Kosakonia pseudosacchari]